MKDVILFTLGALVLKGATLVMVEKPVTYKVILTGSASRLEDKMNALAKVGCRIVQLQMSPGVVGAEAIAVMECE